MSDSDSYRNRKAVDGYAYEFFLNLPFGETMVQQHSYTSDFTNRYKFTGKELDAETDAGGSSNTANK